MTTMGEARRQELLHRWGRRLGMDRLSTRERLLVAVAVAVVILLLVVELVLVPLWQARTSLQRSLTERRSELAELSQLVEKYRELQGKQRGMSEQLARRPADFSLFAYVEEQAERAGARRQLGYIRPATGGDEGGPRQSTVEVKLQRIGLEPLVRFLQLLESAGEAVVIRRIVIQESGNSGLLDASLQVIAHDSSR